MECEPRKKQKKVEEEEEEEDEKERMRRLILKMDKKLDELSEEVKQAKKEQVQSPLVLPSSYNWKTTERNAKMLYGLQQTFSGLFFS